MFITHNKVRMHDTDMAGILYFPRQFRFAHDALEDFIEQEGYKFLKIFKEMDFVFVIVHCEADYFVSLVVGDQIDVHLSAAKIGNASFTLDYKVYRSSDQVLTGTIQTVHVCLDKDTRKKIPVPQAFRAILEKHLLEDP